MHNTKCVDGPFLDSLRVIERAANDERNFVKKGVSWVGKDVLRELSRPLVAKKLARR